MKICILSMQMVPNMGSVLQSYALKKRLEELGAQVEFLDIKKSTKDNELMGDFSREFAEEREKTGLVGKISKIDKYAINRFKIKRKSIIQNNLFDDFRADHLRINQKSDRYDLCVIGSDEVFNCLSTGGWGFTSQLFGNVPEADSVITYAASCGSTEYEALPRKVADCIRKSFQKISSFSVRDGNTHKFVSKLTEKTITDNLDPVLIYNFRQEIDQATLPSLPEKYCVVYSYYNRIHTTDEIDAIKKFCKRHQLTPIAVGAPQFWIKDYIVCSPFQCLKIFENAEFVITDTFHGTIFASKLSKRFAVLTRKSNYNKLADLIEKIGMQDHLIDNIGEIENKYGVIKNTTKLKKVIERETERTIQYLRTNID